MNVYKQTIFRPSAGAIRAPAASSDAFVFFGATGDLAYKKIFPALQAMIKRGELSMPIVGVSRDGWSFDKLRERARASLEKHGPLDAAAFAKLAARCDTSTATTRTR